MAAEVAPPKNTGGGGFVFENDVCAWLLACMLVGEPVFGAASGVPLQVDFQTRPEGWFLDDVLVTTRVGGTRHRFALSVKSNSQFTAKSAPADFVAAVWEQWLHIGSTVFDRSLDFIGLVTAPLSGAAAASSSGLVAKARDSDPVLFPARVATPNWASEDERSLFASFTCPASLGQATEVETARLLQRLRFIQRDFGDVASKSENDALELCRRAVRSQVSADAQMLWSILREVASELRPLAGSLTLTGLIDRLRVRVQLAEYPDHATDWEKLDARSLREVSLVRNSIGESIRVPRDVQVAAVVGALRDHVQVALVGPSGVGKSALARAVFERRRVNDDRTLWVDASSLDRVADFGAFEAAFQLLHPLAELLGQETSQDPLLILDGLDRLYSEHAFRSVATLLRMVAGERSTRWRVLAVCQSQEWQRTLDELRRAGGPMTPWSSCQVTVLAQGDLENLRDTVPTLGRLLRSQPAVFANLKFLDLVVRRLDEGAQVDASTWVGESSVAEWFWREEIDRGRDKLERGKFARTLAERLADDLVASVPVDAFDAALLSGAQSLTTDTRLVRVADDRIAFAHDLYGDWARLRILLTHRTTNLVGYLQERHRHESPLWHRAIRLLGIHLLEREDGVDEWKTLMSSFASAEMIIVRDLLLEAPAFAMNARVLLDRVFPHLVDGDGELLRRLLMRFLAFATVPNEQKLALARGVGMDVNAARVAFRFPNGANWLDMLTVLHVHCDEALQVAACEVARIVEMWLELSPPGAIRRSEAADLAVLLGQRAVDSHDGWRASDPREHRRRFYKCMLLASPERPDQVALLARVATERLPKPVVTSPPSQSVFGLGVVRGPWPDGPLARADEDFQHVVLEGDSVRYLFRERPSVAREVVLAALIKGPHVVHWGSGDRRDLGLVHRYWQPSSFSRGPFLLCLRDNFDEGLELIMRLVEFASEQSSDQAAHEENDRRELATAEGREPESGVACPDFLLLHNGATELRFTGDVGSYGWSAGLTLPQGYSPLPPSPVASALMALEQHFYRRIDVGEDIRDELAAAFTRTRCVAALGVLVDVGKRQPTVFNGPLRALLSAPELYSWDLAKVFRRTHLPAAEMEHRNCDLRAVAANRLLKSAEMQTFFGSAREWWKQRRADGEQIEMADQLELLLDPAAFEVREDPTHGHVFVNVALERTAAERAQEHRPSSDWLFVAQFSTRCRTILDERPNQTDAELVEFWETWMRIRELANTAPLPAGGLGDEYVNAITGGIAVLLWSDQWLSRQTQGREEVEGALVSLDFPSGIPDEYADSKWTWDGFLAESVAMLWARAPHDARWRPLIANMVFGPKYAVVGLLFSRCAEYQAALGADFARLRRLALDWAQVRPRVEVLLDRQHRGLDDDEAQETRFWTEPTAWCEEQVAAFVEGTLTAASTNWSEFEGASRFAEIDALPHRRDARLMDFHLVRCSHEWMPLPDDARNEVERAEVLQFWRVALDVVAARPRADLKRRDHQYPDEDEVWVLENVAAVVLQLRPNEKPELFWAAIVDLHSEGHHWPHKFFDELHARALHAEQTPDTYERLLRQIADRALSEVDGKPRWSGREAVWDALIGIDGWVLKLWAPRHSRHVVAVWDVVAEWMKKAPRDWRRLGRFAGWLSKPAAADIRLGTLAWFLECVRADKVRSAYRDEDPDDALAKLLNVVWEQDQNQLRASAAFRGLLAWLVERQNALGMELQGRIGGLTG